MASRLGRQDSNLGSWIQSPLPYHLATPEWFSGKFPTPVNLPLFHLHQGLLSYRWVFSVLPPLVGLWTLTKPATSVPQSCPFCFDRLVYRAVGYAYDEA
jgi:hypothetical protein